MTDTTRNHTLQNTTMLLPHNKQNSTMQHNHNLNFPFVDLKLTKLLLIAHLLYFQHFFAHGRHARHECRMLGSVLQTQPEAVSEESPAEIVSDDFKMPKICNHIGILYFWELVDSEIKIIILTILFKTKENH